MAHVLKYYKELTNKDGSVTRLEIHRDNSDGLAWIAKEIGPVLQQLSLNLQGDTEDIDAPIVKTSLNMTFVDAPDHAQASARKCGDWDEFYTSDSTKWMVVLKAKRAGASSFSTLWSGYLTPDSYSEQLRYRGSVTFVARDNIGHMQDFPFDAEGDADGMISLYELVQAAWAKIESPMELLWRASEWLETGGVEAFNTIMNVSAFDGMNWYEAVEKALYSYGAVLRYIGGNEVMVTTLRYLPSYGGNIDRLQRIEPVFVTGAQRELIPAVRRIEESAEYKIEDMIAKPVQVDQFTGETQKFQIQGNSVDFDGVAWPISQKESGHGWCNPELSLFFNPSAYDFASEQGEDANSMFIACNLYQLESLFSAHYAEYSRYMLPKDVTWRMRVGAPYRIANATLYPSNYVVQECSVVVSVEQGGVTHYLQQSGEWGATKVRIKTGLEGTEFFLNIPVSAVFTSGQVLLKVQVHQILTTKKDDKNVPYPALVVPVYMTSINASYALCKRNNFNTNYSERNNVILSRDPELAPALNEVPFPEIIKNGIFYRSGGVILPAKKWSWNGSQEQHLALYNHLQLLCYHAKPFNVITGAIVNADLTRVNVIYEWHGAEHILISGSYDYLSGRIEGAVLREFSRYDEMWTGANFPPYEENSSTNVGGGSNGGTSGGGGGGGGSSAPTGNFVTKDELIAEIGEAYPIYLAQENDEQKEANRAAIAAYVAAEVKPVLYPYGETRATAPFSVITHEMEDGIEAIIQYRVALGAEPTMGEAYYLITAKVNKDGSVEIQNDAPADYILPAEEYVKEMIGESYPVYTPLDAQQELTEEQKAVNKDTYDAVVAAWDADVSQMPYLYLYDMGKQFPCLVFDVFADEGYIEIYTNVDAMPGDLADFGLGLIGSGLLSFSNHIYLHSDGSVTDNGSNLFLSPDIFTVKDMMSEEVRILYVSNANGSITAAQQEYNKETFTKIEQRRKLRLVIPILGIPVIHSYWDGKVIFTIQFVVQGSLFLGQGALLSDGSYEYEEFEFGQGGGGITTETDPVFLASPAAKITDADITRWNDNTGGGSVTVDSAMSDTSTNPVQNKTVKAYVDSKTATAGQMPVAARVEHVFELTPNILHRWSGEQTSLTITLKSVSSAYAQHYMMQFTTSSSGCTLSLPSTIKWQSGLAPVLKPSTTYMISIVNDLGVWSYYE